MKKIIFLFLPFLLLLIPVKAEEIPECFSSFENIISDNSQTYRSSCNDYVVDFNADKAGYKLFKGDISLDINYPGEQSYLSSNDPSNLRYVSLLNQEWVNIIYSLKPGMLKEDIVLSSKPSLLYLLMDEFYSIPLQYSLTGLDIFVNEDKVAFVNQLTTQIDLYFPELKITDNTGASGLIKFGHDPNSDQIFLNIDSSYLENAVYPVTIDPTVIINPTSDTTTATQPQLMRHVVMTSDGTSHAFVQIGTQTANCGGSPLSGLLWFNSIDSGATWTCQGQLSSDTTNKFYAHVVTDISNNIYTVYSVVNNTANSAYDLYYRKLTKGVGSTWTLGAEQKIADGDGVYNSYSYGTMVLENTDTIWVAARSFDTVQFQNTIFYSSDLSSAPTWTPDIKQNLDKVWLYTAGSSTYTDETADANSLAASDVTMPGAAGDIMYFGSTEKFQAMNWTLGTFGTSTGAPTYTSTIWEYWNGSAWTTMNYYYDSYNSSFMSENNGTLVFVKPADWVTTSINSEGTSYYYLRFRVINPYAITPVANYFHFTLTTSTEQVTNGIGTIVRYGNRVGFLGIETQGLPVSNSLNTFHFRADGDPHNSWVMEDWHTIMYFSPNASIATDSKGYIYSFSNKEINLYNGIKNFESDIPIGIAPNGNNISTTDGYSLSTDGNYIWIFYRDNRFPDAYVYRKGWPPFDAWQQYFTDQASMADYDRYATVIGSLEKVWSYINGAFADMTEASKELTPADAPLGINAGDATYFGSDSKFAALTWMIYDAPGGGTLNWEYWNGSAWSALTITNAGLRDMNSTTGFIEFNIPGDWAANSINGEGSSYYYVRAAVNTNYSGATLMTAISNVRGAKNISASERPINDKLTVVWTQDNTTPSNIGSEVLDVNSAPNPSPAEDITKSISYNFLENPEYNAFNPNGKTIVRTSEGTLHYIMDTGGYREKCNGVYTQGLLYFTSTDEGVTWTCKNVFNEILGLWGWANPTVITSLIKDDSDNLYFVYSYDVGCTSSKTAGPIYYYKFTKQSGSNWTIGPQRLIATGTLSSSSYSSATINIDTTNNSLWVAAKLCESSNLYTKVAVFNSSDLSDNPSWTRSHASNALDKYWSYYGGVYTDDTVDAGDLDASDVQLVSQIGDIAYFGKNEEFNNLAVLISNTPTLGLISWEYWDGSSWAPLQIYYTSNALTLNLRRTGSILFTVPSNWAVSSVNGEASSYYYIRARVTGNFGTIPSGTVIQSGITGVGNSWSDTHYPILFRYGADRTGIIYMDIDSQYYLISRADSDPLDHWELPQQITSEMGWGYYYTTKADAAGTSNGNIFFAYYDQLNSEDVKFTYFDGNSWSSPIKLFTGSKPDWAGSVAYDEIGNVQVLTDDTNVWVLAGDSSGLTSSYRTGYEPLAMVDNLSIRRGTPPYQLANFSASEPVISNFGTFDQAWSYNSGTDTYIDETQNMADADVPEKIWRQINSTFQDVTATLSDPGEPAFDRVWSYINGQYANYTYYAVDGDTFPMVSTTGDSIYFGLESKFESINWNMDTYGADGIVTWEYWNGSAWSSLSFLESNNTDFYDNGFALFNAPLDWEKTMIDPGNSLLPGNGPFDTISYYYIRARVTSDYTTAPQSWLVGFDFPFVTTNDYLYLGHSQKFNNINFDLTWSSSGDGTAEWEYWDGSLWQPLTFIREDSIYLDYGGDDLFFTAPVDWETTSVNGEINNYYYVRAHVTSDYYSLPNILQFSLGSDVTPLSNVNDIYYFGDTDQFDTVSWDMVTQTTAYNEYQLNAWGGGVLWEYWNGDEWVNIPAFVETSGENFSSGYQEGYVQFKIPDDWTTLTVNGEATPHYYVRARINDDFSEPPLIIQAVHIPINYNIKVAKEIYNNTGYAVWHEGYGEGNISMPNYTLDRYKFSTLNIVTSANNTPNDTANLSQFKSNGTTPLGIGAITDETTAVLKFDISDIDNPEQLRPELELRATGTAFTGTATHLGNFENYNGSVLSVSFTVNTLINGTSYHWQVRVCDDQSACSNWISFGGNLETEPDFSVSIPVCGNNILETGEACDGNELGGYSCTNFPGYGAGTLTCSISCTYDVSACIAITPTPSPTATPVQSTYIPRTNSPTPTPQPELEIVNVRSRTIGNEVEICWDTNLPSTGYIKYGIASLSFISSRSSELTTTDHCVRIPNLEYDNTYDYEIIAESDVLSATYESDFAIPAQLPVTGEPCSIELKNDYSRVEDMIGFTFSATNGSTCTMSYGSTRSQMPYSGVLKDLLNGSTQALADPRNLDYDNGYFRINCQYNGNLCSAEDAIPALQTNNLPFSIEQLGFASIIIVILLFLLRMISFPFYWLYAFAWAFLRRKSQTWGIVYDQRTRLPIPFAVVRIYDMSGNMIKQTVTDLEGKYGFILDGGNYALKVSHSDYQGFEKNFTILSKERQYAEDIALNINSQAGLGQSVKRSLSKFTSTFFNLIWVLGFIFSLITLVSNPLPINMLIVAIYLIQLFVIILIRPARGWGLVYDSFTDKGLPGAFVRVQDKLQGRQIDVQLTDNKGRYGFKLGKGDYLLIPSFDGYSVSESSLNPQRMGDGTQGFAYDPKLKADFGMRKI